MEKENASLDFESKKIDETRNYLSDCNGTRTHNHLVCKRTLNHLAKLINSSLRK